MDKDLVNKILSKLTPDPNLLIKIFTETFYNLFVDTLKEYEKEVEFLSDQEGGFRSSYLMDQIHNLVQNRYTNINFVLDFIRSIMVRIVDVRNRESFWKKRLDKDVLDEEEDIDEIQDSIFFFDLKFVNNKWSQIEKTFYDLGYDFHYFNFFKHDEPLVQVFWDNIKLDPKIYEAATSLYDTDLYDHVLSVIKGKIKSVDLPALISSVNDNHFISGLKKTFNGLQITGWRKLDLKNAIMKTGLNIPIGTGKFKSFNGKLIEIKRSPLAYMFEYSGSFLPGINNISKDVKLHGIPHIPHTPKNIPYMSKYYYEAIYRKLFNTLSNVDWSQVCQLKLVKFDQLQKIAIDEFGFSSKDVNNSNYATICNSLTLESERRRDLREELKLGIPDIQPMITLQPGSQIVSQSTYGTQQLMAPILGPQKEINNFYGELYNLCSLPYSKKENIYFAAKTLGLTSIIRYDQTKEEMCKTLISYIENTQTRKLF